MALYLKSKLLINNIFCLLCVTFLVNFFLLYIMWNLTLTLIENPQFWFLKSAKYKLRPNNNLLFNALFHYELVMNFSWSPKDSHNRYKLYIAWWNRTLKTINGHIPFSNRHIPFFSLKITSWQTLKKIANIGHHHLIFVSD